MARPSQADQRRKELLPVVAQAFSELGYRRATTAALGERCGVQENVLYRLWDDKKAMFLAAIDFLSQKRMETWRKLLDDSDDPEGVADRLIEYEVEHLGEAGFYRVIFAGLGETDDPEIHEALRSMYQRYQQFLAREVKDHREAFGHTDAPSEKDSAWTIMGLVTMLNIMKELDLMTSGQRKKMFSTMSRFLLDGGIA